MDTSIEIENIIKENKILKNQLNFLIECINNQMRNLELLCKNNKTNLIHIECLKPYYQKAYKCEILYNINSI